MRALLSQFDGIQREQLELKQAQHLQHQEQTARLEHLHKRMDGQNDALMDGQVGSTAGSSEVKFRTQGQLSLVLVIHTICTFLLR